MAKISWVGIRQCRRRRVIQVGTYVQFLVLFKHVPSEETTFSILTEKFSDKFSP
jgi:16S rRNA U1498 N3-methylase RsmE